MKFHIGIDLCEISRFRTLCKKDKNSAFLAEVFTERERTYCFSYRDPWTHLAGTFAAKEAVFKTGIRVSLCEIEVRRLESGLPEVWARGKRVRALSLSITHTKTTACAVALR